jgi:hypothetical protein
MWIWTKVDILRLRAADTSVFLENAMEENTQKVGNKKRKR